MSTPTGQLLRGDRWHTRLDWMGRRLVRVLTLGVLLIMASASPALAQDTDAGGELPPFDSGWTQVLAPGGEMAGNATKGFVVIGGNVFGETFTNGYYSPDGRTWQPMQLETPTGDPWGVSDVAVADPGFVAVTQSLGDDGDASGGFISFSADGRTWERIDPPGGLWPHHVVGGPTGFVALSAIPGGCPETDSLWFSADGRTWTRSELPFAGCDLAVTTSSGSGWHAVIKAGSTVHIVTSTDGMNWITVDAPSPPPSATLVLSGALLVRGDVWALSTITKSPPQAVPELWASTDGGRTWSAQTITPTADGPLGQYQTDSWAVTDLGLVGVGLIEDLTDNNNGYVLHSTDGTNWSLDVIAGCCRDITANGDGVLGASYAGVYAWNPELAATGPAHIATLTFAGVALVIFGSAIVLISAGSTQCLVPNYPDDLPLGRI